MNDLQHINQFPSETYWVDKSTIDSYLNQDSHQFRTEARLKQSQFQSQNSEFIQLTDSQIVKQQEEIRNMDLEFNHQGGEGQDGSFNTTNELLSNISYLNKGPPLTKYDNHSPIDE